MRTVWTIIFGISTLTSFSQTHLLGIKGGVLFSNSSPDYGYNEKSSKSSFTGGLTYDIQFKKSFVISTEILYTQYGFEAKADFFFNGLETITGNYNYNYITLPLKAGVRFGSKLSGFVNIGVVPSFLTSAKSTITTPNTQETFDIKSNVYEFDFSILGELGADYRFTENMLFFTSVTYQHSLRNITKSGLEIPLDSPGVAIPGYPLKHYGISISLGLKYRLN
jgi:outer membrane protein with beta-barrel domain